MTTIRRLPILLALGMLAAGCQQSTEPPAQSPVDTGPEATEPAQAGDTAPLEDSPKARARAIRASGREGVWQSIPDACTGGEGSRVAWHVPDPDVEQVAVYLVGANGEERIFAKGGTAGEKVAGRWLRAGMSFVVRDAADGRELARTTLSAPDCR